MGVTLRLWGVEFGLPSALLHLDEPPIVLRAEKILETGDANPHWFHYPSLYIYLQVCLQAAGRVFGGAHPFLLGRLTSVGAAALTLLATFGMGRELHSRAVGLLGALLLAVSFLHARESHFATVDATATLWVVGCLYLSVLALKRGSRGSVYLWTAGALAGLSAGTKYNAGIVLLAPLAVVLFWRGAGRRLPRALGLIGLAGLVFLASTPFAVLDSETFLEDVRFESRHYREGHFGFEGDLNAVYFARYLFAPGLGEGVFVFVLLGLLAWSFSRDRTAGPLLIFAAAYYASISSVRINFVRNLVPIVPVLCLLGGLGVWFWLQRVPLRGPLRTVTIAAVLVGLVALPVRRVVVYDRAIADSTRLEAGRWIQENVPAGATLAFELYGPEPISRNHRVRMLLHLADRPIRWYEEEGVDYLVASSGAYEMAYRNRERYPEVVREYDRIFERFPLVHRIEGETIDPLYSSISPTIGILAGPGTLGALEPDLREEGGS